jgi:hypothetical protein
MQTIVSRDKHARSSPKTAWSSARARPSLKPSQPFRNLVMMLNLCLPSKN